ncbi:recombinase family protein [Adhaeribacter soli]|uniref:Recombinase family protein n=1 Tax=Adhaeribacter soli TaxID=2607655 RepID=A0A5N1INI1_9BACT|nr:recombinase family protein [Adhaeribacter soli]KAA9325040.1 recombinase family protein [Adhaeribacter soli]
MAQRKAVIYTRVSTDDQAERGFSLKDQEIRLRRYCRENNIEIEAHYQDDHSAKNFNRPKFKEFLSAVKAKEIKPDLFLCVRMDRFSRNVEESLAMIKVLKSFGITFKTLENDVNLDQPENLIPFFLNMLLPQVENERRGLNTKRGMRQAKREGRWVGTPPKGYSFVKERGRPVLVPNSDAQFVISGFEEVAKGLSSTEQIRFALRKRGFVCSKNQFYNILRNPIYIGRIRIEAFKDEPEEIVNGQHAPLVGEELFYQVQDALAGRKRKAPKKSCINENLPLRGYLICPRCGNGLTGSGSVGRAKIKYYYYHCQHGCKERFRADEAEVSFLNYLSSFNPPDEVKELFIKIVEERAEGDENEMEKEVQAIESEVKKYQERLQSLEDKFIDDLIDRGAYLTNKARYNEQVENLLRKKDELQNTDSSFQKYFKFGITLIGQLRTFYRYSSPEVKQKIVGSIFPQKLIFKESSYRTTQPNEFFKVIMLRTNELEGLKKAKATPESGLYYRAPPLGLEPRTP